LQLFATILDFAEAGENDHSVNVTRNQIQINNHNNNNNNNNKASDLAIFPSWLFVT
jgi:hypothetical protein